MAASAAFAILMLFWPVLFGLVISLAIVGKGLRLIWLPLALGICVLFVVVLWMLLSSLSLRDPSGIAVWSIPYIAGGLLLPAGHFFRKWRRGSR